MGRAAGTRSAIIVACVLALLPSCATIVSTSTYSVPIRSEPPGAEFTIHDRQGRLVHRGRTPAIVDLKASNGFFKRGIYRTELTFEGRTPAVATLRSQVNGWYWGNVVFGGLIGFLIVDPWTGAMYRLDRGMVHELLPVAY